MKWAQTLAAVSHRNLATVYGFKMYHGTPMIIMEFVDGSTLAESSPLPLDVAIEVIPVITEVVACLQKTGVVHRDIKPRNIAFNSAGDLKLLDLGLARLEREVTMSGIAGQVVVGTPSYLSPEAHGHQRAHPSLDLWALSVIFYEVLTGRHPFEGGSPEELAEKIADSRAIPVTDRLPTCSSNLTRSFETAFAPDSTHRPRDAEQLAERLRALR